MKGEPNGKTLPLELRKPPATTLFSMVKHRAKFLGTLLLILGGLGYVGYRVATAPEWQEFHAADFWRSLVQLRLSYLALSAALVFASYYLRVLRWQVFLHPLKKVRAGNIFVATLIGFSAVALLGRPGEAVRPLLIARKEQLAIPSQLAAWTLERVFDILTIGLLTGTVLIFLPPQQNSGSAPLLGQFRAAGMILGAGSVGAAAFLALLRHRQQLCLRILRWFLRPLPERYANWVLRSVEHFSAGLASLDTVASLLACSFFSLLVWSTLLVAYWGVTRSLGWPMARLGPGAIVLLLAASVAGSMIYLPGIGGGTQVAIVVMLTALFGIPLDIASSAAIVLWGLTFLMVLIPGLPLAVHEGLNWRRLRSFASARPEAKII